METDLYCWAVSVVLISPSLAHSKVGSFKLQSEMAAQVAEAEGMGQNASSSFPNKTWFALQAIGLEGWQLHIMS